MTPPLTVSVIIPNYNYGDYVGAAIQSALNLDWPDVEVIVVDDGSTDHSRAVIAGFGSRLSAILQENAGQLSACNKGFSRSRGEIVIFLDSDDLLAPSLVREVAAVWTPRASKVQVQMQVIDATGEPTGSYFPQYAIVPSPEQVRAWMLATGTYPTPPGSGNVYARWFLARIFPLREVCGIEAARAVAHVEAVVITAHRGQELVPPPEGGRYPGFIFARAGDPETAVRAVREAHARLDFVLE